MGLNYEKQGHVAKVGLNRPEQRNALDPQILMDLHGAWKDINADETIRVVILYSSLPDIFCSGMDLKTAIPILTRMREPESEAERWLLQVGPHVAEAMLKPNIVKKPVIAAVNGYCLTGGFEMIMGADLRVASEDAVFQMRESSLGIMPTGGSNVYLPRILTPCRAMEILLTGRMVGAEEALRIGLANAVVEPAELMAASRAMLDSMLDKGPLALQAALAVVQAGLDLPLEEAMETEAKAFAALFATADLREGTRAFMEKRKAAFKGE